MDFGGSLRSGPPLFDSKQLVASNPFAVLDQPPPVAVPTGAAFSFSAAAAYERSLSDSSSTTPSSASSSSWNIPSVPEVKFDFSDLEEEASVRYYKIKTNKQRIPIPTLNSYNR
jgi:hypothetical protein